LVKINDPLQGFERVFSESGIRENAKFLDGMRDLTATRLRSRRLEIMGVQKNEARESRPFLLPSACYAGYRNFGNGFGIGKENGIRDRDDRNSG